MDDRNDTPEPSCASLTTRMGGSISRPTEDDLRQCLEELFSSRDDEHPDASVEYGTDDDGPLYSISIFSSGYALYTKYSDYDMSEEIEHRRIENVDAGAGLKLWLDLIAGKFEEN